MLSDIYTGFFLDKKIHSCNVTYELSLANERCLEKISFLGKQNKKGIKKRRNR